jgi:hypothetical protein
MTTGVKLRANSTAESIYLPTTSVPESSIELKQHAHRNFNDSNSEKHLGLIGAYIELTYDSSIFPPT